MTLWLE